MDIRQIAIGYIKTLSVDEQNRVKDMLDHGIICGAEIGRNPAEKGLYKAPHRGGEEKAQRTGSRIAGAVCPDVTLGAVLGQPLFFAQNLSFFWKNY